MLQLKIIIKYKYKTRYNFPVTIVIYNFPHINLFSVIQICKLYKNVLP